jgi:hypothetical protein
LYAPHNSRQPDSSRASIGRIVIAILEPMEARRDVR